jgi:hypothetical protein
MKAPLYPPRSLRWYHCSICGDNVALHEADWPYGCIRCGCPNYDLPLKEGRSKQPLHRYMAMKVVDFATFLVTSLTKWIRRGRAKRILRAKQVQSLSDWHERWEVAILHCWRALSWEGKTPDREVLMAKMKRFEKNHNKLLALIQKKIDEAKEHLK